MPIHPSELPPFSAPYAPDDRAMARRLLQAARLDAAQEARIDRTATRLIDAIRANDDPLGGVEDMLREFALSTKEGLALMVLAEALLRVPDARTADQFIEDKLGQGDFVHHETKIQRLPGQCLGMGARHVGARDPARRDPAGHHRAADQAAGRAGGARRDAAGDAADGQPFRARRDHRGRAFDARSRIRRASRYSFDMLGEGARTAEDAERYFNSYASAIEAIGRAADDHPLPDRPGISVKLSALHPRFEAVSRERVMTELVPRLIDLARQAKTYDLNFTVDAEEADRLELSLDVIAAAFGDPSLAGWDGFGLAIQAYQKRAARVIDYVDELARGLNRRMMVRLVKGAYWDTEIKRAQERGLDGYPVFTRKAMTDLNYVACAQKLLALRPRIFPQFATHNALTVATILELAKGEASGFEFQRLHGMGEALYAQLGEDRPEIACRTYAPVGSHRDLLAYLVRRLLENGANSSFVALAADEAVPVAHIAAAAGRHHRQRRQCRGIRTSRCRATSTGRSGKNSRGIEFGERAALNQLVSAVSLRRRLPAAGSIADATIGRRRMPAIVGRARRIQRLEPNAGRHARSSTGTGRRSAGAARGAFHRAAATRGRQDAGRCAFGSPRGRRFLPLLRRRGPQAVRRRQGDAGTDRREQLLCLRGRGVFVAISPWNFPLAIFLGQVTAALMAGNAVVAKPAEQTPLIAAEAVRLLHEAGVPTSALHLVPGDGRIGAALVAHPDIAGVVFTGSTEVARSINRTLAAKDGPIVPLIAETGGINAMIVDATALPEQVADDVVTSAFRSAGQRCSALRLLFVQDDVADRMIEMIAGAARELDDRRSPRPRHACRPGDRCRGQTAAGRAYRANEEGGAGAFRGHRARRQLRRAAYFRIGRCRPTDRRSVRTGPACGALPRRPARPRAAIDRTLRLRADARHPLAHRRYGRGRDRRGCRSATSMSTAT